MSKNRCNTKLRAWVLALVGMLVPSVAGALTLTLTPSPGGLVTPGSTVFVDVGFSGLTAGGASSLTAFELDVSYDEAVLDFEGLSFGTELGAETCILLELTASCEALAEFAASDGLVELGSATLLLAATINASQSAFGSLATLEFTAQAPGLTGLEFTQLALSGTTVGTSEGTLSGTGVGATIGVIPEPATGTLVAVGILLLARLRRVGRA